MYNHWLLADEVKRLNKLSYESEFKKLNDPQKKAVETTEGRILILAGAGSGKTKVLTMRSAHLILNCNVHPKSILGLTFTNKAASEMKQRVSAYLDNKIASQVTLCTFHSFCMNILRKEIDKLGLTKTFSLYDEYDVQRVVTQIARELLKHESTLPSLAPTIKAISDARSRGLHPDEIENNSGTWHDDFFKQVYKRFVTSMTAYNAVDFDNLLYMTLKLFQEHLDVLEKYQERFSYIMIDEYQDTNGVQYLVADLLSKKSGNLCVVGDDDQAIYGWRGAEIKHILEFENNHLIKLEQNYRSTHPILQAANSVIKNNKGRHHKELWSNKLEGPSLEVYHAPDEEKEAESVVHRLALIKNKYQLKWKDFAILYRSNALSRPFEQALLKYTWKKGEQWIRGIPYQVFGGEEYYERREIKDLIAYLRIILNPSDQEALLRIINVPRRGIGDESLDKLTKHNRLSNIPLWQVMKEADNFNLSKAPLESIKKFVSSIEEAKLEFENSTSLYESLKKFVDKIEFKRSIEEEVKSDKMRAFKWDNVQTFIDSIKEYEETAQEASLHDFVTSTPLGTDSPFQKKKDFNEDRVNLMTFHSSKGLEFNTCFLVAIEDEIIPHEKSLKERGLEEERRLMYVALTRAKERLICSMARTRKRMGALQQTTPSRFLVEIPKDLMKPTMWNFASY